MIKRLKLPIVLTLCIALFVSSALALNPVKLNPEYFPNPAIGRALSGAQIYVGIVDLDPKIPANQKTLSVLQENGTTVAVTQPLSTGAGGVPVYNGSPVTMLVDGSYSLRVDDSTGSQVYYVPKNAELESVLSLDSIADLRAITTTPTDGDVFTVLGYYTPGDGGGGQFYWDATSTATDNGGTIIKVTSITTGRWIRLTDIDNTINVAWFGAIGAGNETTILLSCAAVANGGTIIIPFPSFEVSESSEGANDCGGAIIEGNNTVLTGDIANYSLLRGIIKTNNTEWDAIHPIITRDLLSKFIYHSSANVYTVIVPTVKNRYAQVGLVNNVTSTDNSLAVTGSDITSFRVASIRNNVATPTGYTTASAQGGSWIPTNLIEVPPYTSGTLYTYERSPTSGGYSEYTITMPVDGFFSVSFVRRSDTSADVDVSLDGVVIGTAVDTVKPVGGDDDVYTIAYSTSPGEHVVRVTNNTTDDLRFAGVNFAELRGQRSDVALDTFGAYRDDNTYNDIISAPSENDVAIFDADATLWGNGYHGGESNIVTTFILDGVGTTLALSEFEVCSDLEIIQNYDVDWSGEGGGSFYFDTAYIFKLGGYYNKASVTGSATDNVFYPTLFGIGVDFDELASPKYFDLTGAGQGKYYQFKTNMIEYRDSSNGQRVRIEHTQYNQNATGGGPFVLVQLVNNYHKYYNSWIEKGKRAVTDLSVINAITVE